ncbi:MAG: hypothetical protein AB7O47_02580 [Flavobacteriales bacterium]
MKKVYSYLITLTVLVACNSQKTISVDSSDKLKNNQFIGEFVELTKKKIPTKEIYFKINEKTYFVKFDEGYVSKEEVLKFLNQTIKVKGELKNGEWESSTPGSLSTLESSKSARKGDYFVVNKIYK